jgi:hypothetical protein
MELIEAPMIGPVATVASGAIVCWHVRLSSVRAIERLGSRFDAVSRSTSQRKK